MIAGEIVPFHANTPIMQAMSALKKVALHLCSACSQQAQDVGRDESLVKRTCPGIFVVGVGVQAPKPATSTRPALSPSATCLGKIE